VETPSPPVAPVASLPPVAPALPALPVAPAAPVAPAPPAPPEWPGLEPGEEALFPEARRLRRRRWAIGTVVGILLAGIVALVVLTVGRGDTVISAAGPGATGALPLGPVATLHVAGPLAVAADGALYVSDVAAHRVLVRLPDGRFRTVAGDGKAGFSGDGGPAVRAELAGPSDLAFARSGALYIADGGRVRVVGRDGVIRTIAGNGRGRSPQTIANGTPALSANLGSAAALGRSGVPLSLALAPGGQLYISTGWQILRLTATGKLDTVRTVMTSGPYAGHPLGGFGPIAVDRNRNVDVAGVNGWAIWQVSPDGAAREIGSAAGARRSGGDYSVLERGPGGFVFGEDGPAIERVEKDKLAPAFTFGKRVDGEYFWLTYFAFGPGGATYADEIPGGSAFETQQQLVSVKGSRVSLLWQQGSTAPK